LNIYIAHKNLQVQNKKALFILTRPFYKDEKWIDLSDIESNYKIVDNLDKADFILIPFSINYYYDNDKTDLIAVLNEKCIKANKKAYAFVSGDFGAFFKEYSNIIFFRMGGFASQLSNKNKGFPVALSDHFQRLYQLEDPKLKSKEELPIVGFCGHATLSNIKRGKELLKFFIENVKRFFKKSFSKNYEPYFASAFERAKLLKVLEKSDKIKTNFIYRKHYRAGAQTEAQRTETTLEYYDNIKESDYVVCVRGAGNFSVRFYETLMMGKIPIFVNTDCLLPFENTINWKEHLVWVEWKDRDKIAAIVSDFHNSLSDEEFMQRQINNRKLWKHVLSVDGMLEKIANDI
jgi:hypothetical protein